MAPSSPRRARFASGRERAVAATAVVVWVLVAASQGAVVIWEIVGGVAIVPGTFELGPIAYISFVLLALTWATVGAVLMLRRPSNVVGPVVMAVGVGYGLAMVAAAVVSSAIAAGPQERSTAQAAGWLAGLGTILGGNLLYYLALIFPTGRGHNATWHWVSRLSLIGSLAAAFALLTQPGSLHLYPSLRNPLGVGPDLQLLIRPDEPAFTLLAGVAGSIPVAAMVLRYRAGSAVERLQLRWFVAAVALTVPPLVLLGLVAFNDQLALGELPLVAYALTGTAVPAAIGVAVLRHHLFDIDRIISRTIGYAVITGVLAAVFVVVDLGLGAIVASLTGGGTLAVAAATLVVAMTFQPLRRRIQAPIDRRFNRARVDANRLLGAFGERVRHEVDLRRLRTDVQRAAAEALDPVEVGLWLAGAGLRGR